MELGADLVGRRSELAVLHELIDRPPLPGGAIVIRGDPGIGKSALLDAARRIARARGRRVLATVGVQSEAQLPFAGLYEVLRPLRAGIDRLPPTQRHAQELPPAGVAVPRRRRWD